jgi:hypothetical protein
MKFTMKDGEEYRHGHVTLHAGNTYDTDADAIDTDVVQKMQAAGLCSIEGKADAERKHPKPETLEVQSGQHAASAN